VNPQNLCSSVIECSCKWMSPQRARCGRARNGCFTIRFVHEWEQLFRIGASCRILVALRVSDDGFGRLNGILALRGSYEFIKARYRMGRRLQVGSSSKFLRWRKHSESTLRCVFRVFTVSYIRRVTGILFQRRSQSSSKGAFPTFAAAINCSLFTLEDRNAEVSFCTEKM